jgi:hypothetical protein
MKWPLTQSHRYQWFENGCTLSGCLRQDGLLDGLADGVAVVVVRVHRLVREGAALVPAKFGATVLEPDLKSKKKEIIEFLREGMCRNLKTRNQKGKTNGKKEPQV